MATLTTAELAPSAIAAEKDKLADAQKRARELSDQLSRLQQELEDAQREEKALALSVRWRELMAAVNADDAVYGVADRLTDAFNAFRESMVEPENYVQSQREDLKEDEEVVPFSDTDDYADFSNIEAVVEDVLAIAKEAMEESAAAPLTRSSARSSPSGSFAQAGRQHARTAMETEEMAAAKAAKRRRALLQLLVLTVLMGKVEEHCDFSAIPDPSNAPRTEAEELRDGVASVWQWIFYEQPTVLTEAEREEWFDVASTYLGEAYTEAP